MFLKYLQVSPENIRNLELIIQREENLFVNIPVTQQLFDNLTLLTPAVWEILIPVGSLNKLTEFKKNYDLISISPTLIDLCNKLKVEICLQSNGSQIQIPALSPELAVIYTVREITIPRIFVALGLLQSSDAYQLKNLVIKYYPSQIQIINFLLDLASIRLYRSDEIWPLLNKYKLQDILGRFSLYVRDFIKNEFIYEKIM
ncbi:MAG TPA: hypothetical protein VMV49_12665 [Candidatus Deferrimicrobium sp.]|nr:hypothetical protein [Candidatus Deferrimicrobium sp.]